MNGYGAKHEESVYQNLNSIEIDIEMYVTDHSGSVLFLENQLCVRFFFWFFFKQGIGVTCMIMYV